MPLYVNRVIFTTLETVAEWGYQWQGEEGLERLLAYELLGEMGWMVQDITWKIRGGSGKELRLQVTGHVEDEDWQDPRHQRHILAHLGPSEYFIEGYKRCSWCQLLKPTGNFYPNRRTGGLTSYCKACSQEKARQWRQAHLERASAYTRKNTQKHREYYRQYAHDYYQRNRERIRQQRRALYQARKEAKQKAEE